MKVVLRSVLRDKKVLIDIGFILLIICMFSVIFGFNSPKEVINSIIEWNRGWEWAHYWWGLYIIYFIEIFLLVLLWDIILYRLFFLVNSVYRELTHFSINKRWLLIKLIRIKYGFDKLYYYLKPRMLKSSNMKAELIDEIMAPRLSEWIKLIIAFVVSFKTILAGVLTLLTYDKQLIDIVEKYSRDNWLKGLQFLWDNFSKLSAVIVIVLVIFLWYFVSRFGVIKRAVAQANKKKLEDVIQLFRKLDEPIINIIIKGSENIQYAIDCYDLIIDFWTFNKYPSAFIQSRANYMETNWRREGASYFLFREIPELNKLINELESLRAPENKRYVRWFSRHKFELVRFINMTDIQISQLEDYDRILFTKKGFGKMNENDSNLRKDDNNIQVNREKIKDEQDFFIRYVLNRNIVEGIELLYALYRYTKVIDTLLHMESDKFGRGVRLFTGKE